VPEKGADVTFFILRNGLQFGPYSRQDLQDFLRSGELYPGDLGRTEAMKQWLPVSRILGVAAPPPPSSDQNLHSQGPDRMVKPEPLSQPPCEPLPPRVVADVPAPPSLHCGVLLLLMIVTLGLFGWLWSFVIARWARNVDSRSRAMSFLIVSAALSISSGLYLVLGPRATATTLGAVFVQLLGIVLFVFAMFTIHRSLLTHYFLDENPSSSFIAVIMTLLFNVLYFQHQFNRARRSHPQSPTHLDFPRTAS
jgi:GYF domain 2